MKTTPSTLLFSLFTTLALTVSCDNDSDDSSAEDHGTTADMTESGGDTDLEPVVLDGYPVLGQACDFGNPNPTHMAVASTDDSTGSVGYIDITSKQAFVDLALGTTDMALRYHQNRVYLINRFGADYIDILDANNGLSSLGQFKVTIDMPASSNPHSIAIADSGLAYVTVFGGSSVQVFNLSNPAAASMVNQIDLSSFADADGKPEMSATIKCGNTLFVSVERLDTNMDWVPVDTTLLVPIRSTDGLLFDFANGDGIADGIPLLGTGVRGFRRDPIDPTGHQVLILNDGLERVNLATGQSSWIIDELVFEQAGIGRFQLASFDISADGQNLWFVVASEDWSEHALWQASISGSGADLIQVFGGISTTTGAMKVIQQELWVADTTVGNSGIRVFDLNSSPPTELPNSPISTGLPPYTLVTW